MVYIRFQMQWFPGRIYQHYVQQDRGLSDTEIMSELGIGRATLNDYTPYTKGIYGLNNPTENAKRIRKSRGKE